MRVYDRVLRLAPRVPLPVRNRVIKLCFKGMNHPFYLRLGSSDLQLHQTIRFRGEYRPIQDREIRNVSQVVDLGSNAGYTIRLWERMFPAARIIGVEPDPENLRICRLNAHCIPGAKVDLIQACVVGKSGTVFLDRSESEHRYKISTHHSDQTIEVVAMTVQEVLDAVDADLEISLMKCDVQGAEMEIFRNCKSWISRVRNLIVEVHPPYTVAELMKNLNENGWRWAEHEIRVTDNLPVCFFWGEDRVREC
jgi:FkbM family methyltransferase